MPKFSVDVKAFIRVDVEAPNAAAARAEAEALVEAEHITGPFLSGWNDSRRVDNPNVRVADTSGFEVDGDSEVERVCSDCGEVFDYPLKGEVCQHCLDDAEPIDPPDDTPSLDTSFHDHEMDV